MNARYPEVALRALHRCEYCHAPEAVFNMAFEVEHIIPLASGGLDDADNLALACRSCNVHKGSQLSGLDTESGAHVPLFNPRRDAWTGHFRVDAATHDLVGVTPAGRVTVACLRSNNAAQRAARQQWVRMGLFP